MSPVTLHTATLDGKAIAYSSETDFKVQVAKGRGSYRTRYSFKGRLDQAVLYFNAINLGYGWRKRLIAPGLKPSQVIARAEN